MGQLHIINTRNAIHSTVRVVENEMKWPAVQPVSGIAFIAVNDIWLPPHTCMRTKNISEHLVNAREWVSNTCDGICTCATAHSE